MLNPLPARVAASLQQRQEFYVRIAALYLTRRGSLPCLSTQLGHTKFYLTQLLSSGRNLLPVDLVLDIEQITSGAVSRGDFRPDLWPAQ